MKKNYIAPRVEDMQLSSELIMQGINVVHASGGGGTTSGFGEGDII